MRYFEIKNSHFILFALAAAMLLFFPVSFTHLFDWDEINFAESSREMLVSGNYFQVQVNFEPFQEKPPFFFWLQTLSYQLFGVNEYAARFPNALFGLLSVISLYLIGKRLYNSSFGFIWAVVYLGSILPFLYAKSGIIDPVFNLFIFLSLYFLIRTINESKGKRSGVYASLAGVSIGLAIITKGPVGFLLILLSFLVFWSIERFRRISNTRDIFIFALSALSITTLWFGYETIQNGPWFLVEFIKYQIELFSEPVAGHAQPFYYHFVVILLGCFPMSFYALPMFFQPGMRDVFQFRKWMAVLFWVVLILFSISTTKIVHYSSMCYLPLSYLAALHIFQVSEKQQILSKALRAAILIVGIVFSILFFALPLLLENPQWIIPYIKDDFAVAALSTLSESDSSLKYIAVFYLAMFFVIMFAHMRKHVLHGVIRLSILNMLFLSVYLNKVVPEIEAFSQRPAIEFFKELKGQDVYVNVIGYKSYAQLFYFDQPPIAETERKHLEWQLHGDIDKPVYLVTRVDRLHEIERHTHLKEVRRKGGFVLFVRELP
jgi:4-amino-4-deoxy-L-arabinose transferase-like glycosyltransferase